MRSELGYVQWKEDQRSTLESLADKRLFLLFSGGKDSSLAMDFFLAASQEFGFALEAHAGAYPVHRYGEGEKERIESYWGERGIRIIWHTVADTDEEIKGAANPCLVCQKMRKRVLRRILEERVSDWENLVLIACYTLWDLVSYALEHLQADLLSDSGKKRGDELSDRFVETAQRFYPLLTLKEGYSIYRPLIKYNGPEIARLLKQEGIPTLSSPCRFSRFRPKRILEEYYDKMNLRFDYEALLKFAQHSLHLPRPEIYSSIDREEYLARIF